MVGIALILLAPPLGNRDRADSDDSRLVAARHITLRRPIFSFDELDASAGGAARAADGSARKALVRDCPDGLLPRGVSDRAMMVLLGLVCTLWFISVIQQDSRQHFAVGG